MGDAMQFGVPGVDVASGEHLCAIFVGPAERDEVLVPFLDAGLRAGDKCICVVDGGDGEGVLGKLGDGIDVEGALSSDQLHLRTPESTYLRSGQLSTEDMIGFWESSIGGALATGRFRHARSAGEATWPLNDPDVADEMSNYESELNRFVGKYPQVILCLYDLERHGAGILLNLLTTHPKVLLGGIVLENPHYLSPDEYQASRR
jgi:hypothetical protein